MIDMVDLVLYHANCMDGLCAAWVYSRRFPAAEFHAVQYGDDFPDVTNRSVAIVDFSYPRESLIQMHEKSKSMIVLDHHKTAAEQLIDLPFCKFDMYKSGGRLAWEHLNGNAPSHWLVDYTEDRDLWTWKLPYSRAISAALAAICHTLADFSQLASDFPVFLSKRMVHDGEAILLYQETIVAAKAAQSHRVLVGDRVWQVANATTLISETAGRLATIEEVGCCWFELPNGSRVYSLRSAEYGPDVSLIAREFGGGGHIHAAGFRREPMVPHPWN